MSANTQSTITLIINGEQAKTSLKDVTSAVNATRAALAQMHQEDNPELYEQKIQDLKTLREAQSAMKDEINSTKESNKSFFGEWKQGFEDIEKIAKGVTIGTIISMGIRSAIETLVEFKDEMVDLIVKASGIDNAFAKIGNTDGLLEKLRASSRGLITDLDLETLATKANNANIPLEKMGMFLQFAQQRARDTGQDVTAVTNMLIEGVGKGGTRALAGLGISVQEIKDDFAQTGNMVTTVGNIIQREMAKANVDVDNAGDRVLSLKAKWEDLKDWVASKLQQVFYPELADPEAIQAKTTAELKEYGDYKKFEDDQLAKAIKNQQDRVDAWKVARKIAQKNLTDTKWTMFGGGEDSKPNREKAAKKTDESYQGSLDALDALKKEQEIRTANRQHKENNAPDNSAQIKAQQELLLKEQELKDALAALNASEVADTQSAYDKELAAAAAKYDALIKKQRDYQAQVKMNQNLTPKEKKSDIAASNGQIDAATNDKQNALDGIKIKQAKETADAIKKYQDDQTANFTGDLDKQLQKNNDFYDNLRKQAASDDIDGKAIIEANRIISNAQAAATAKLANDKKYHDELQQLEDEYDVLSENKRTSETAKIQAKYDKELAMFAEQLQKKLITQKQYDALVGQATKNKDAADKIVSAKKKQEEYDFAIDTAKEVSDAAFSIEKSNRQANTNAAVEALEDQKNKELSATNLTATQKAAITQKYADEEAAVKLKAWKADQVAAEEQAIINGALAVLKALAQTGVLGTFVIPGIIAATAIQVALIASQKPPQFAKGGVLQGSSHAQGGLNVIDTNTGNTVANVEGGEPWMVLSKETQKNNGPLISQLLFNSMYRNGASVDVAGVSKGITVAKNGAYFSNAAQNSTSTPGSPGATSSTGSGSGSSSVDLSELVNEMRLTRQAIKDQKVILNRTTFDQEQARMQVIIDRATT